MRIEDRIQPDFGHWFAGFVDGEGCFYIARVVTHKNDVEYVGYRCAFTLSLRDDDRPLLEEIQRVLGTGKITTRKPRDFNGYKAIAPMAALQIGDKEGAQLLMALFDHYPLRSKKRRDYLLWREAVADWCSRTRGGGRWRGRHDWARMAELHETMKDVRRYVS